MSERRTPDVTIVWAAGAALVIGCIVAVTLILGGGAPVASPPGIDDPSLLLRWLTSLLPAVRTSASIVTIGLVAIAVAATTDERTELRTATIRSALAWGIATGLHAALLAVELRGRAPILGSPQLRGLLMAAGILAVLALVVDRDRRMPGLELVIAVAAIVPPVVVGHARTTSTPWLSTVVLTAHIAAAAAWIGGLLALAWLALRRRPWWNLHIGAFSKLAVWSVIVVAATGTIAALGRVDTPGQLLTSSYGAIMALKIVLLLGLIGFGQLQRQLVVARHGDSPPTFLLVAGAELTVMAVVVALATALAQTPPPG